MSLLRSLMFTVSLALVTPGAARAAAFYRIQPLLQLGDKLSDGQTRSAAGFWVGTLNDNGQIAFVTGSTGGSPTLVQYADGSFTPIVVAGQMGPVGKWPQLAVVWSPVSMDQNGNIVFSVLDQGAGVPLGTFRWDHQAKRVTSVALKGVPAVDNQTLAYGGGATPTLNNRGEIALVAGIKNAGGEARNGVFFLGQDGKLLPVAVPDGDLPGGRIIQSASNPSISDGGAVAFLATAPGETEASAYSWEKGQITPVAVVGTEVPGKVKLAAVWGVRVNNKNRNLLVEASVKSATGAHGLYLFADGRLTPVAVPGQPMPDGGSLETIDGPASAANDAGQHAFLVRLVGSGTAAYLVDSEGRLSLIVKSSETSELGQITRVGEASSFGISLNNKGQVALAVKIAGFTHNSLVLLTPAPP